MNEHTHTILKEEVVHITKEDMEDAKPRIGEKVVFTTEKDGEVVYGKGVVKEVNIVDQEKGQYLFIVEAENGEFYPIHFPNFKGKDTIIMTVDNERYNEKMKFTNIHQAKKHYYTREKFMEQQAYKELPEVGDIVAYETTVKGVDIKGKGKVVKVRLKNAYKKEALVNIEVEGGMIVQVYHNNERYPNDKIN